MSFFRLTALWTGPGGPGASHFDYRDPSNFFTDPVSHAPIVAAWRAYYNSLAGYLPNEWSIGVQGNVLKLSSAGALEDDLSSGSAPAAVAGSFSGAWAAGIGVVTRFETNSIVGGRRLRGRTFFVPVGGTVAFDSDGTLNSTCQGDFNSLRVTLHNAAATNNAVPIVWSKAHATTRDITGWSVRDRSAILRSRRD